MATSKQSSILTKAKQGHFDFLRKNNAITDAKNGDLSLGAMKTMDIVLKEYQDSNDSSISLKMNFLRKKLNLMSNNEYMTRIKGYMFELKLPFELRDFTTTRGKKSEWGVHSLLNDVDYIAKTHSLDIDISPSFINYMVEKAGYTNIPTALTVHFKTKFGYKIYEMYLRYLNLPNKVDNSVTVVKRSIDELNERFGTDYNYASDMKKGIKRGVLEIFNIMGIIIEFEWIKTDEVFQFSWQKQLSIEPTTICIIPTERIDEVVDWILQYRKSTEKPIKNMTKYKLKMKSLIKKGSYKGLEEFYRGLMFNKYGFTSEEIDNHISQSGKYKNFKKEPVLFNPEELS